MPRLVLDSRYPPVSRPASDFAGAVRRSDGGEGGIGSAVPGSAELLCRRPIHHVLEYAALYRRLERLHEASPGVERRLWLRSALGDEAPFAELPVARVERVAGELPRGIGVLPDPEYRDASPESAAGAAASGRFFEAAASASPRWLRAPGADGPVRLPDAPSILLHQARFHLGDSLWMTPLLRALHRFFPGSRTTLVGPPVAAKALAGNSHVTELLSFDPAAGEAERRRLREALAGRRFDAALFALVHRPESRWLAEAVAETGVPIRVNLEYFYEAGDGVRITPAFTHEGWFFWGTTASPRLLLHALDPFLGPDSEHLVDRRLVFAVGAADRADAARRLAEHGVGDRPFAVLAPGGSSSERWPPERFAELAGALTREHGWDVVLEGTAGERALLDEIAAAARPAKGRRVVASASPLATMAALLERARLLVANDSAPIHLAEAVGAATLYFAQHEKITHSHPAGKACWALYDDVANRVAGMTLEQAMGAVAELSHKLSRCGQRNRNLSDAHRSSRGAS